MKIEVSHPGVAGKEVFDNVNSHDEAIEAFRAKHGRIRSVHPYAAKEIDEAGKTVAANEVEVKALVDQTELAALGLAAETAKALVAAGLTTKAKIAAFGDAHKGLTAAGLSEAQEVEVAKALRAKKK